MRKQTDMQDDEIKPQYDFRQGRRGLIVPVQRGKTRITIRLDSDIIEWFKTHVEAAGGGSYQTLMNDALRAYMQQQDEPLEDTLRRVLREELARYT